MITPTTTRGISQLAEFNQWVVWRREPSKDGKLTKVPYNPKSREPEKASSTNPKTWGSYEQARAAMVGGCYDGIGFTLWPAFVPLVGIDIDHCIDEQGNLSELARGIVTLLDSYTEISPSGTGIRIFLFGDLPPGRRKHTQLGVEMYVTGRFLTVTENHLPGSPEAINHRTNQAAQLHRQIFGEQKPRRQPQKPSQVENLDDQALLEMIRKSKQGPKFERLWAGAWQPEYPSQSEADFALVGLLYWWSGGDEGQTKRLFALSGLHRAKWDRADYQARIFEELSKGGVRSPFTISSCKTDSKVFTLKPYRLSAEAQARKERILAESKAQKEERAAELAWRQQADSAVPFLAEEQPDPEEVRKVRRLFTNAKKWAEYCQAHWPDLDPERQRLIKLAENKEDRPDTCGEEHWRILTDGTRQRYTWTCGICDRCRTMQIATYQRALNEIQGTITQGEIDELKEALQAEAEAQGLGGRQGEPAPPLARVHGPLSVLTLESNQERVNFIRKLRRQGIRYRCLPVEKDGQGAYDFIVNSDEWGDPLGVMATEERLKRWVVGYRGRRASGDLLPSLKSLEARYREPLPWEVVLPELDDAGQPVEEDIIYLDLPSIGTRAKLPQVAVDFEVKDRESLQAALLSIHDEQVKILTRRKVVIYGVCSYKRLYIRHKWLSAILAEFNANNERIKAKQATG